MAYSYFEELVFLLLSIRVFLVIVFNMMGVFLMIIVFIYALGGFILRRVVPFLRSNVNNRYVDCNVMDIYYLDFLIGVLLNKITLFPYFR